MVYTLEEGFLPEDRSWIPLVQGARLTRDSKVLYRPKIVKKFVEEIEFILANGYTRGLLVKGPQGVGKSHVAFPYQPHTIPRGQWEVLGHHNP